MYTSKRLLFLLLILPIQLFAQFDINVSSTPSNCNATGSITIDVKGGKAPYCYNLSPCANCYTCINQNSLTYNALGGGTYTVTVNDNSIPSNVRTVEVKVDGNYQTPTLFGKANNCTVTAVVSGGQAPFKYAISWDGGINYGPLQGDTLFTGVKGKYCIRVIDACGNFTPYCSEIVDKPLKITAICDSLKCSKGFRIKVDPQAQGILPYQRLFFTSGTDTIDEDVTKFFSSNIYCPPVACSWKIHLQDACGEISSVELSCSDLNLFTICSSCEDKTASFRVEGGVPPYQYFYYSIFNPTVFPNPAGVDQSQYSGLPDFLNTVFRVVDGCGVIKDVKPPCLAANLELDCDSNSVRVIPFTTARPPYTFTCESCTPKIIIVDTFATFKNILHPAQYTVSDSCNNKILLDETFYELEVSAPCGYVYAQMKLGINQDSLPIEPAIVQGGLYRLYDEQDNLIDANMFGLFSGLKRGTYRVQFDCPALGIFNKTVTMLQPTIRITAGISAKIDSTEKCVPVYNLKTVTGDPCTITDINRGITEVMKGQKIGSFYGFAYIDPESPYRIRLGQDCIDTIVNLPKLEYKLSFVPPICPLDGNLQLKGAQSKLFWKIWGEQNTSVPIVNQDNDFYTLDCIFNPAATLSCKADSIGKYTNQVPGSSHRAYLYLNKEYGKVTRTTFFGEFCPLDTLDFIFKPENYQKPDSLAVDYVSCLGKDGVISVNIRNGAAPFYFKIFDCDSAKVLFDTVTNVPTVVISNFKTGTYCFQVQDGCGNSLDSKKSIIPPPDFAISSTLVDCDSSLNLLQATTFDGATYSWTDLSSGNKIAEGVNLWKTNYAVATKTAQIGLQVAYKNCVIFIDTLTLNQGIKPDFNLINLPIKNCKGSLTYELVQIDTPYTAVWNGVFTIDTLTDLSPGAYSLILTDKNGCTKTLTTSFDIQEPKVNLTETEENCTANLIAKAAEGRPPYQFQWNDTKNSNTDTIVNLSSGNYQVTVTDSLGCQVIANRDINLLQPKLTATAAGLKNCEEGIELIFRNGTGPVTYIWSDGTVGTDSIRYPKRGKYTVVAIDAKGCKDTLNFVVGDTTALSFEIYNAISPDGNQINERFVIKGIELFSENEVIIYNRWGHQVYRKQNYRNENGWDGNFVDQPLPDGTYYYVIFLTCSGKTFTGFLEIRR